MQQHQMKVPAPLYLQTLWRYINAVITYYYEDSVAKICCLSCKKSPKSTLLW